jgi:hypothetical protein
MPDQFCPNCGTEVDADARFCPSCGATLTPSEPEGEEIPAAPAWPPVEPEPEPDVEADDATRALPATNAPMAADADTDTAAREPALAGPPRPEPAAAPAPEPPVAADASPPPPPAPGRSFADAMPSTWPTTLSRWLIGGGALVGALVLIPRLAGGGYLVSLLLFLALLGIAATVFLADHIPHVPQLRLITLCTAVVGLGVALARAAFSIQGIDTLLLIAMLAAAGGALLLELDMDRPFPPPDRAGS